MFSIFAILSVSVLFFNMSVGALNPLKPMLRGATAPLANLPIFDPNVAAPGVQVSFLREAELKHGRLAMLAAVILPTLEQFTDGLGIHQFQNLDNSVQIELVYVMLVSEFISMLNGWENPAVKLFSLKEDYQPGDFQLGLTWPLWNTNQTEEELGTLMDKELNNGRLAMIGVLGIMVQELVTGKQIF
jgi:light-harvesting complex I chlorophyll a/b binding protein 1